MTTAATQLIIAPVPSPVGTLLAGATDAGLCLLEFADRRALPSELAGLEDRIGSVPEMTDSPSRHRHLDHTAEELTRYFTGDLADFTVPLDLHGTPFQLDVWNQLRLIPFGRTRSYDALARALGKPGAPRAVGRANGQNRIAIIIPCHRVINKDGTLCGYGGGLQRKRWLIDHEASVRSDEGRLF